MSFPTVLSPWFTVYRQTKDGSLEYYKPDDGEDKGSFTPQKSFAMLFMTLNSAARVAKIEDAEIRVLVKKEDKDEFGR